ncbi:hypothetical protein B0O99DRAFT_664717 [Bisporella sp. PMI_857]|nr:hypothetical protein B0O99DRAFT_664717 [Bisporella sp. PMI_857]
MAAKGLKTVLITGCSGGGIGSAIAQALAQRGHHIFATARDTSKIPTELSSLSNVTVLRVDVVSQSSISASVNEVAAATEELGSKGLNVLVNNAGIGYSMPVLDLDIKRIQALYDVNVWGPVRMVHSAGACVNTPWIGAYCSSKAALTNISETMRLELAPLGISVLTVMIGIVETHFARNVGSRDLPANSRYMAIKDIIAHPPPAESKSGGSSAKELAESLIDDIIAKENGEMVWRGSQAGTVRFLSKWLPAFDRLVSKGRGLDELSKTLQK